MPRKLIIRRVGVLLPTICLVILILLGSVMAWLSFVGMPRFALDYIEDYAARYHVYLRVEKVKLSYTKGLGVHAWELRLYEDKERQSSPLITVPHAQLGVSARDLFEGIIQPNYLTVEDACLSIPIYNTHGKSHLTLEDITLYGSHTSKEGFRFSDSHVSIYGVLINIQAVITNEAMQSLLGHGEKKIPRKATETPKPIGKHILSLSDTARHISDVLMEQDWKRGENMLVDIDVIYDKDWDVTLRAQLPSMRYSRYHFKKSSLNLRYNNDTLTINNFQTQNSTPAGSLNIKGNYHIKKSALSFRVQSDLPAMHFAAEFMKREDYETMLLHLPTLERGNNSVLLQGDIDFDPNYGVDHLVLQGDIRQKDILIGGSFLDEMMLSFYYSDGSFSLEKLSFTLPQGELLARAHLRDGFGEAHLSCTLLEDDLRSLLNSFLPKSMDWEKAISFNYTGALDLKADASISTPDFRPGSSAFTDFIPDLRNIELNISVPELELQQEESKLTIHQPDIELKLTGLNGQGGKLATGVGSALLSTTFDQLHLAQAGQNWQAEGMLAEIAAKNLQLADKQVVDNLNMESANGFIYLDALQHDQVKLQGLNINLREANKIQVICKKHQYIQKAQLDIEANNIELQGKKSRQIDLSVTLSDFFQLKGRVEVQGEETDETVLSLNFNWHDFEKLWLSKLHVNLPATSITRELPESFFADHGVQLEDTLQLHGSAAITTAKGDITLQSAQLDIEQAHLHLRGTRIKALQDANNHIQVQGQASIYRNKAGDYQYGIPKLQIKHEKGQLTAQIHGASTGQISVKAQSTLPLPAIKEMVDEYYSNFIMRDFAWKANSKFTLTDIEAQIDYSQGVRVHAETDVRIQNAAYVLGGIFELKDAQGKPTGSEYVRRDLGQDPFSHFHNATAHVTVDVLYNCLDSDGKPLDNLTHVDITNATVELDNNPWIRKAKLERGTSRSIVQGDQILLDIDDSCVRIRNVRGEVYPAYTFGMYFPSLYEYMEGIHSPYPMQVTADACTFPISSNLEGKLDGVIKVTLQQEAKYTIGGLGIPLQNFSGYIVLNEDHVQLDQFNANCWEGVADLTLRIGFEGGKVNFDGFAQADAINLQSIGKTLGEDISPALAYANFRFRAARPELQSLEGYGRAEIRDAQLMELAIFSPISELITNLPSYLARFERERLVTDQNYAQKTIVGICNAIGKGVNVTGDFIGSTTSVVPGVNYLTSYDLTSAKGTYRVGQGRLYTDDLVASGSNLTVPLSGYLDLEQLTLQAELKPEIGSILSIALLPVTSLSGNILHIDLHGEVKDIKWRIDATNPFKSKKQKQKYIP